MANTGSQACEAAGVVMGIVQGLLSRRGRLKRPYVTPAPREEAGCRMMLVGRLLNRKREEIGSIRVYVWVVPDSEDVNVRVEWTRNAFGFWYREDLVLSGAVEDPLGADLFGLNMIFRAVGHTADGDVSVKSMNRMHRKVKKNKTRDRASRLGLMVG